MYFSQIENWISPPLDCSLQRLELLGSTSQEALHARECVQRRPLHHVNHDQTDQRRDVIGDGRVHRQSTAHAVANQDEGRRIRVVYRVDDRADVAVGLVEVIVSLIYLFRANKTLFRLYYLFRAILDYKIEPE